MRIPFSSKGGSQRIRSCVGKPSSVETDTLWGFDGTGCKEKEQTTNETTTIPKSQSHLQKQFHKEVSLEVIQEEANSSFYTPINLQSRDEESVYTSRTPRDSGSHSDPEDDGYSEVTYNPSVHELSALTHSDKPDNLDVSENPDITAEISVEKSIQSDNPGVSENPDMQLKFL